VLVLVPSLFLVGFFFAQLGVLVGVRAEQFDDVSFYQTFLLQPLIFLGGVFYSASLLPEPFETLTHIDPVYYMIGLVRYGFIGYSDTNVPLSLVALTVAALAVFAVNYRLFAKGYKLRV
jgi:ABC-2 type transport system permease protein